MALKKCPICGEKYSDTYKNCPFCEEEEALNGGGQLHRRGGRRTAKSKEPNILSPILIIILLILVFLLFYMFFGHKLLHTMGLDGLLGTSSSETSSSASGSGSSSAQEPVIGDGSASSGTSSSAGQGGVDTSNLPETLTISSKDFTMKVGDAPVALKASGGAGTYTWTSDNESVATVDTDGKVTAIAAGTANIVVTDGTGKGTCIVRVKGTGSPNTGGSSGTLTLSSTDFTLPVGESYTLSVSGAAASSVTWTSENPAVATVNASGTVTGVAKGRANIIATVNGTTLKCTARVK